MYYFNFKNKEYIIDYDKGEILYDNIVVGEEIFENNEHLIKWDIEYSMKMNYENTLNINNICIEEINIRKNCDNKSTEYIEALCHIIPDMETIKDIPENKHKKLIISDKNLKKYLDNISKDKQKYVELIRTKYEYITKYGLNKDIEYIYIPGKFNDNNIIPQEIKNIINNYDIKQNKADYYIKYCSDGIRGFSVKDTEQATKINYSIEKCILGIDPILSKYLSNLRKYICISNGVNSNNKIGGARDDECRKRLNKIFNRLDLYHTTIDVFIKWNNDYVKNYIINNMFSLNVDYPIYECVKGKIFNINKNNIIESKLESYHEAELRKNGEERNIAKLFYKLSITFNDGIKKQYRLETRIKGTWWSGSVQFQSHLI